MQSERPVKTLPTSYDSIFLPSQNSCAAENAVGDIKPTALLLFKETSSELSASPALKVPRNVIGRKDTHTHTNTHRFQRKKKVLSK